MKKMLIIIFGLIVILCLAGILLWNMFPTIISHKLSKQAGVSVTISDIRASLDTLKVDGIRVGNPSGYSKTPRALSVDDMKVSVPLTRFFDKNIVIDEMTMDDVYIGLEFDSPNSKKGNWTTIMNNMSQSSKEESEKAKAKGETTTVLIKRLVITDLQIELAYTTGGKANKKLRPIDRIELTNISSEGGIPTAQIMNIVMQETLRNIFSKEGLQNMLEGVLNPSDSGGGVMNTLKGLFSDLILLDNDWDYWEQEEFEEAQ
ncbi:MAG: AsmA family protein [Simkaniaceae bacterium]|jgi:hypothetical protein|nr:MAG: AsmA family protein [Simkaniaceae bacterium]